MAFNIGNKATILPFSIGVEFLSRASIQGREIASGLSWAKGKHIFTSRTWEVKTQGLQVEASLYYCEV